MLWFLGSRPGSTLHSPSQLLTSVHLRRWQVMTRTVGSLTFMWETQKELRSPGFSRPTHYSRHLRNRPVGENKISLCLCQIKKNINTGHSERKNVLFWDHGQCQIVLEKHWKNHFNRDWAITLALCPWHNHLQVHTSIGGESLNSFSVNDSGFNIMFTYNSLQSFQIHVSQCKPNLHSEVQTTKEIAD